MKPNKMLLNRLRKLESEELGGGNTLVTLSNGGVIAIKPENVMRFCCNALNELSLEESLVKAAVNVDESDNKMFTLASMIVGNAIAER
jgi:hypothetical protein